MDLNKHERIVDAIPVVTILLVIALLAIGGSVRAQAPPPSAPSTYTIPGCETGLDKCVDGLKLKLKQSEAMNAQMQMQQAQASFNNAMQALQDEANRIKNEAHMPTDAMFDPGTLSFRAAPKQPAAAAPAPAPTPTPKKP